VTLVLLSSTDGVARCWNGGDTGLAGSDGADGFKMELTVTQLGEAAHEKKHCFHH
jgi:hypothetical protein